MAEFSKAVEALLADEGGYVCHPNDPGGETNFGISKRRYPEVDVKALTREQAIALYARDFWNPLYDKIPLQKLADKLFGASVNMTHGDTRPYYETPMKAVELLQLALSDERSSVTVDGKFGPQTLMAVKLMPASTLLRAYRARLAWHYAELRAADAGRKPFCLGWMRRAVAVLALALLPTLAPAQFDALEGIERDFLRLNDACDALPAEEQTIGGQEFRIRRYRCGARLWRLWELRCPEGYWSHVVKIDSADWRESAYYMDRFASWHRGQPAELVQAYARPCRA